MAESTSAKEAAERGLRDIAFKMGLNERDIELCVDYFVKKLSHKEISIKYNIELQTSLNKKSRLKKLLKERG